MFGRLFLVLAVMWRLCSPQAAFAMSAEPIRFEPIATTVQPQEQEKQAPLAATDKESEESEPERDDAGHNSFPFSPALPSYFRFTGLESISLAPTESQTFEAGACPVWGHAPLYVLHAQFRL